MVLIKAYSQNSLLITVDYELGTMRRVVAICLMLIRDNMFLGNKLEVRS